MYLKIKQLREAGFSERKIVKQLSISRTTVTKYLKKDLEEMSVWMASTKHRQRKLDAYQTEILAWLRKGQQRIIPTRGQYRGAKLIGSLDYETGEVLCIERETYDAQAFLEFLQTIGSHYSGKKIAIVLDNARIHHAKLIQPFLEDHRDQLELVFLPPYSPQLNLIEGLWKWLKASVINNVFFPNVQKIKLAVRGFIQAINRDKATVLDRLCVQL